MEQAITVRLIEPRRYGSQPYEVIFPTGEAHVIYSPRSQPEKVSDESTDEAAFQFALVLYQDHVS